MNDIIKAREFFSVFVTPEEFYAVIRNITDNNDDDNDRQVFSSLIDFCK